MIKPSFGRKNNAELQTNKMFAEEIQKEKSINCELEEINNQNNDLSILNENTVKYIIENFPDMSLKIKDSLINLIDTLENTIDYIEDESSKIVKEERNFTLSKSYRKISVEVYDMVKNIQNYSNWIEEENLVNNKKSSNIEAAMDKIEDKKEKKDDVFIKDEGMEIYRDFSSKNPNTFKLHDNIIKVEDWDDLLVKTAEILNKKYKENKKLKPIQNDIKIANKKSNENTLRNTVIEMLNEYRINLEDFKIIVH
ncbi:MULTISPECIES: viral A-type inclusion protein [unclassified Clostridium]|uniref:viral A-type inclusion protein n=1 Tax=unclassified Clostridium TaxID=2614128 RepID=UPI0013F076D3|nr:MULTISPECIES: viral A-type inclusion protein [unclassified Clostridium]NFG63478.1 viral A-type inclusion protein [Clostridium botulinum]NFQ08817.1 viral A-type inclusion protein [Clostridium botulinum]